MQSAMQKPLSSKPHPVEAVPDRGYIVDDRRLGRTRFVGKDSHKLDPNSPTMKDISQGS